MNISDVIRKRRKELDLTQSKIAQILGVSTPAVNKWEKGLASPDISLLSPLARLLKIDMNTLLSFNENLTSEEIEIFLDTIHKTLEEDGYEKAFNQAQNKITEFPECILLISSVIPLLDYKLQSCNLDSKEKFEKIIEQYYIELISCSEIKYQEIGISLYFSSLLRRNKFDDAREILLKIPKLNIDKDYLESKLYLKQGDIETAENSIQKRLLKSVIKTQLALLDQLDLYSYPSDQKLINNIVQLYKANIENFNLPEITKIFLEFRLSILENDLNKLKKILLEGISYLKSRKSLDTIFYPIDSSLRIEQQINFIHSYILNYDHVSIIKNNDELKDLFLKLREELTRFI